MYQVVTAWRAAGSPPQDGIPWPRQRWIDRFPSHAAIFTGLPDRLTRPVVRGACLRAADAPDDAARAFLTVMAWGYGPFRVRRLLDGTVEAESQLQAAAGMLSEGAR